MTALVVGKMDRQISLQTASTSQDPDTNEEIQTWTDEWIAAEWLPAGTREAWQAQQRLAAYVDGVFRIHYRTPPPTPEVAQVVFEGRTYDIKGVIEIGRRQGLELVAVARGEAVQ